MSARVFNIVKMAPITDKINGIYDRFNPFDGANPNIRDLMGLHSGIMHILTPRDKERKRYKTEPMYNQNLEIKVFETVGTDSYSSSDYFDSDVIHVKKPISLFKLPSIEKYQKHQMSKKKITFIREELELGQCDWEGDVWKVFIYCFNLNSI